MRKKNFKKILCLLSMMFVLVAGTALTAYAATSITIDLPARQVSASKGFSTSGGTVTFEFKAENNPNCHYYCTIVTASDQVIARLDNVRGDGSQVAKKTLYNVAPGGYYAFVRPIDGTSNGKTIRCTLTVSK